MTLPFAVLLAMLFVPKRRSFAAPRLRGAHVRVPVSVLRVLVIPLNPRGGAGSIRSSTPPHGVNLSVCAAYLYAAIGRSAVQGIARLATSLTLAVATLASRWPIGSGYSCSPSISTKRRGTGDGSSPKARALPPEEERATRV